MGQECYGYIAASKIVVITLPDCCNENVVCGMLDLLILSVACVENTIQTQVCVMQLLSL